MAIKSIGITVDGKRKMTMEQFKRWVKALDTDKDGKISKEELAEAVRGTGRWFAGWKGKQGLQSADSNGDGFVDESEFHNLVEFAQKYLGVTIIQL
ncbi:hypothetical protein Tsubulata_048675 [Turnera subulata]|uniref:EF-hand domain-containing protein n=1 Tax=Turnera subulata TaxID=218843 RepID=A0A9Q0F7K3_9ROSI|nr:hypothetical protein Tsubulata_048675 [Turnera subulata]